MHPLFFFFLINDILKLVYTGLPACPTHYILEILKNANSATRKYKCIRQKILISELFKYFHLMLLLYMIVFKMAVRKFTA